MAEFISGLASGVAVTVVSHPMDTIRVRMQCSVGGKQGWVYTGANIIQKEGVSILFRGMVPPLLSRPYTHAVGYGSFIQFKNILVSRNRRNYSTSNSSTSLSAFQIAIAGVSSGVLMSILATPTELVKTRLQAQSLTNYQTKNSPSRKGTFFSWPKDSSRVADFIRGKTTLVNIQSPLNNSQLYGQHYYRGSMDCASQILRKEGIRGLFVGLPSMALRSGSGWGGFFFATELTKLKLCALYEIPPNELPRSSSFIAGIAGGVLSCTIGLPADVIKTRLQTQSTSHPQYRGIIHCAVKSYRAEGMRVFYRGFQPALIASITASVAALVVYDEALRFCNYLS